MTQMLLYGDTFHNSNVLHVSGFLAPDPVVYLRTASTETLLVPSMERARAVKESKVADIQGFEDLGYQEALDRTGEPMEAVAQIVERLVLRSDHKGALSVEPGFPVLLADLLRPRGIEIVPRPDLLVRERRQKSPGEIEAVARAQARAEQAISEAWDIMREAEIVGDSLVYRGMPLTAERLRGELEAGFAKDAFHSESMIVAPGPRSSDPHWFGEGPIRPNQPLILDIYPQDQRSRFFGDVTRTIVKGEPHEEVVRMYDSVRRAQMLALDMIAPGVNGREVHRAVVQSFADDGFREDGQAAKFTHGTGHGLGLQVHERPNLGRLDVELLEGDVVTVEPGLYHPDLGGVRIEDVVAVTAGGNRNLNSLPKDLVVG